MIPPSRIKNPFPGLRPFEPDQADLFFGRDEQIEELVDRLQEHRFVAVVGTSGSGKSSLVRAGLIPVLERSHVGFDASRWRIAMMRPGRNATEELAAALSKSFGDPQEVVLEALRASSAGLAKYARQKLEPAESLLLLVDQFEELFRYREQTNNERKAEDAAAFVKLLMAASGHSDHPLPGLEDVPVYVVITMRSDFLGRCSQFRGLPEVLNDSQYLVPRMTRDEQREAIEGPVHMVQGEIAANLVQRLLNEVGDNPDQLPVLQHVLMRSWEQATEVRADGNVIEVKDYEDVGGMKEALNRDADDAFAALPDDESKTIARKLFQRLVEPGAKDGETRRPTRLSELIAVTAFPEDKVKQVIEVFGTRGFLTKSRGDDDPIVDIGHESLIRNWKRLGEWVQRESRSAAIYRRLADTAELYQKKEAGLLLDPQLQLALNWREETEPNEAWARRYHPGFAEAITFLEKSKKAREEEVARVERQRKRRLSVTRIVAMFFAALAIIAILFFLDARRAKLEAIEARSKLDQLAYDSNIFNANAYALDGQILPAQALLDELLAPGAYELRGFELFYLWRVTHAAKILIGHLDSVGAIAFSPDGKIVASGSYDKTIILWDVTSSEYLVTLNGHTERITALAFSPDGKTLASSSVDNTVKLWDTGSYKEIPTSIGHSEPVQSLAFSPNGNTLATCSNDKTVKLWDTASRTEITTLIGHEAAVVQVAFSPDGKILASSSEDKHVILWDVASPKNAKKLTSLKGWAVAFSPAGNILASGSDDGTVKLWEVPSGKELTSFEAHTSAISSIVFSPDGRTFATGSSDKSIKLWNTSPLRRTTIFTQLASVNALAFSPDGKTLASVNEDRAMLWDTSRKVNGTLEGHQQPVSTIAFHPKNSAILASGSDDATVKLWDIANNTQIGMLTGHKGSVTAIAFSSDGSMIASGSKDNTVKLWDSISHKELNKHEEHTSAVLTVAFSPDGKTVASGGADQTVKLWDTTTGKVVTLGNSAFVRAVAFSPDGKTLAISDNITVKLWDVGSKKFGPQFIGHSKEVTTIAFSHDSKKLAVGSLDNTVTLWDIASGSQSILFGHSNDVMAVAFSPDDKTLASASLDNTIRLWDVASRKELMRIKDYADSLNTIAFSPDGQMLAGAGGTNDGTIQLWFIATEAEINEQRRRPKQP